MKCFIIHNSFWYRNMELIMERLNRKVNYCVLYDLHLISFVRFRTRNVNYTSETKIQVILELDLPMCLKNVSFNSKTKLFTF